MKYIQDLDEENLLDKCVINVVVPPDLNERFISAKNYRLKYNINKQLETYDKLTEEYKKTIDYIITLGGDGTILWAAK